MTINTAHTDPEALRTQLVGQLRDAHCIRTGGVEAAIRTVPRHLFLPEISVADAYTDQVVVTKREADGAPLSSASQPSVMATMLEQLAITPGDRILEIGAGTGYNAALLRELAGPQGQVTTVEIDPQLASEARSRLRTAGYDDVHVAVGDGALGCQTHAPYDRIIITAGAWDLPPAWWDQLTGHGRIVVPLRWRGQTRAVAFDYQAGRLVSQSVMLCGFIPMQGDDGERTLHLGDGVTVHYDEDQRIDPEMLHGILDQPKTAAWSGAIVGSHDPFDGVWLRLTTGEPGTCRIAAQPAAVDSGLATPAIAARSPVVIQGASLSYFALRPQTDEQVSGGRRHELGAIGHGPEHLTGRVVEQIRLWNHDRDATPTITAYPASTPGNRLPGESVITKRHSCLVFAWAETPDPEKGADPNGHADNVLDQ